MKKAKIVELIESYHGEVNCEPLIAQAPYQKGWVKRLFNTQTMGILKLETFLQSEEMCQLAPDDEIEGKNLLALLNIMAERDKRIYRSSRSYENYPEKSTNRVYSRLYHLLLLDAVIQADMGIQFTHTAVLHRVLFSRIANQVIADLEKQAEIKSGQHTNPQRAYAPYLRLGLTLLFKKSINHTFEIEDNAALEPEKYPNTIKVIRFNNQFVRVRFDFLNGELHAATLLHTTVHCPQDIQIGLQWLNHASYYGNRYASLHLAAFYARRKEYSQVNRKTDSDKSIEYLNTACDQGSKLARAVLERGLPFGKVSGDIEMDAYRP